MYVTVTPIREVIQLVICFQLLFIHNGNSNTSASVVCVIMSSYITANIHPIDGTHTPRDVKTKFFLDRGFLRFFLFFFFLKGGN